MLIWIGVVVTVLCAVGTLILYQLAVHNSLMGDHASAVCGASDRIEKACHEHCTTMQNADGIITKKLRDENERAAAEMSRLWRDGNKDFGAQVDRLVDNWKQAAQDFSRSQRELSDNLENLLREVRVSKQLAQGSIALVEQNVAAIERLLKLVELIRTGPRVPTNLAPSDADAAAHEAGETDAQKLAIESILAGARARMTMGEEGLL